MQRLHLIVQTFLTGLALIMVVFVYLQNSTAASQPSVFVGAHKSAFSNAVLPADDHKLLPRMTTETAQRF